MSKSFFWLLPPAIFIVVYTGIGVLTWQHMGILYFTINGQRYMAMPPHWRLIYNTSTGPFSSIFLANFIFDGWANVQLFGFYLIIFMLTNISTAESERSRRAWFLILGSLAAAFIGAASLRVLPSFSNHIGYGQSAVAAGFAGIVMFYIVHDMIHRESRQRIFSDPLEGAGYVAMAIIGVGLLSTFFFGQPLTVFVHIISLVLGATLAGAYTFWTRSSRKKEKTAILIPEKVRA